MITDEALEEARNSLPRPARAWPTSEIVCAFMMFNPRMMEYMPSDAEVPLLYVKFVRGGTEEGSPGWWDGPYLISKEEAREIEVYGGRYY